MWNRFDMLMREYADIINTIKTETNKNNERYDVAKKLAAEIKNLGYQLGINVEVSIN